MAASRPRVVVLLPWNQDPKNWAEKYALDRVRDSEPYGYGQAAKELHVEWCDSGAETAWTRTLRRRVARYLGFDFVHAWRNRKALLAADVIWTHTEREHLAVALLQRFSVGSHRSKVVAQSVWLWDAWRDYGRVRRLFISWLLRTHSIELVHSNINRRVSEREVPGRLVKQIPFGTSVPKVAPPRVASSGRSLVLAVGNDAGRDWSTLCRAASMLPDILFRIASGSPSAHSVVWPENVIVQPTNTVTELDELYASAAAIVVPTLPNYHASGTTSLIEALAVRRPTIASSAGGLDDYASTDAKMVPPNDSAALVEAITQAVNGELRDPTPDGYVMRGLTQADYVQRYVLVTRWILGLSSYPQHAFRFVGVTPQEHIHGEHID